METETRTVPIVGMPATVTPYTDHYACTVVSVSEDLRTVTVRRDHAKRTDDHGMSDYQSYEYSPNDDGQVWTFTLRKNGRYVQKGSKIGGGYRLWLGDRREYHDYSF